MFNIWKNVPFCERPSSSHTATSLTACENAVVDENKSETFEVKKSEILYSSSSRYLVHNFTGEGYYGKVAKCVNLITSQDVALKILKTENGKVSKREIEMLEVVSLLDPVKKNVSRFLEKFEHKGHTCLAFEMLDRSLFQLIKERNLEPLSLCEIRPIAHQMLTALDALKSIGVVHADLKPDNIMLTNHLNEPFRVKLIDFGVSFTTSEMRRRGLKMQPLGYRAPEVTLGLPISEDIDMWGLGCVLAFLYLGKHQFAINCEYQEISGIVKIVGQPADHLLSAGKFTHKFFKENQYWDTPKWWLKTPREYKLDTGIELKRWERSIAGLDDLITLYPDMQESIEVADARAFVSLLKCLLDIEPERRIIPCKALNHPFVTMAHLGDEVDPSFYFEDASDKMLVCPVDGPEEELPLGSKANGEIESGRPSAIPCTNGIGSTNPLTSGRCTATHRSSDGIINMSSSNVGSVAASGVITAAETSPTDRSPDEGPPGRVKTSRLKKIRRFLSRKRDICN